MHSGHRARTRKERTSRPGIQLVAFTVLFAAAVTPAQAQSLNWGAAGAGGSGTWDNAAANWFNGTAAVPWTGGDTALFGGTAGTVTVNGSVTMGGATFNTSGYTLTGGTLALTGTTPTFTTSAGVSATINSLISGSANLVKTGTGTLTLSNSIRTYTGGTTVSQGTLVFGGNGALGTGTVTLGDANTGASNISLLANFPNFSLGQYIPNNIIVSGAGSGTVSIGSTSFNPGSNGTIYAGTITLNRDITIIGGNADRTSFNGKITGTGNITLTGSRITFDNSANDFVGSVTITSGNILQLDAAALPKTTTLNILGGGQLRFANNAVLTIDGLNGPANAAILIVTGSAQPFTVGASNGSGAYAGVIGNVLTAFTKLGTGTQVLSGANTYTRVTTISGGILSTPLLANGGAASGIGASTGAAANLVLDGGTLQYTGTGASSDRAFTLTTNGGGLDASGSGALNFTSTAAIALRGTGSRALTLTGTNAAATLAAILGDSGGPSSLVKSGAGRWVLTASNSYTGGTAMNAGILQVSADANLGNAAGALTFNGGTLENSAAFASARNATVNSGGGTFQTDADLALSGAISGPGALTKTGTGLLLFTGAGSYAGGTTISAGILQLGNGGTSGSITGNVTDNAALVFDRADALGIAGSISGSGTVSQIGSGTTTLSGINTYLGGTTITAGTLVGAATSFGSGAILDNAALVIDQPADAAFANAINGSGSFTKQGAGRLNYTGTGSVSGPTTVAAGLLSVNGSLANSAVTVQSGASLGGNGTVGATVIRSSGIAAPGNSIGTLHINGALVQNAGSIYNVELDPNTTASDLILVTGPATIQGGAGLNVIKYVPGDYRLGTVYTVLNASGGVNGVYTLSGQTQGVSAFLGLKDSYDANHAYLTVVQLSNPIDVVETPNQGAVVPNLPDPVVPPILNLPTDAAARNAFDQLSGAALASARGVIVANGLYVRDVALDRLRDVICAEARRDAGRARANCLSDRPLVWGQGFGGWGGISGDANAAGVNHATAGMLAGVDVPVFNWRVGLFGGYSHSDFHAVGMAADGGSDDYHLGIYGGTHWDALAIRLGASHSWDGITSDRNVAFDDFTDQLHAYYNGRITQVFGELGYGMDWQDLELEPFANLSYVNLRTSAFHEGGGDAALTVEAGGLEGVIGTLGVRPSMAIELGGMQANLRGMLGWRHTFGDVVPAANVAFAGGNIFTVSGAPIARDAAALEAGLDLALDDRISAGLTYGGEFSGQSTGQQARGIIRISF